MNRTTIIDNLVNKKNAQSYLEIGVAGGVDSPLAGKNFQSIQCLHKIGVDPQGGGTHRMTSEDFFKNNKDTFDIIFVDGLHEAVPVEQDILESLKVLNPGGFIVCHDMNPERESLQVKVRIGLEPWTGDCWKAWVKLRSTREDLEMFVVDTDFGCGIIRVGSQKPVDLHNLELNWQNLCDNRIEWLNLISPHRFKAFIGDGFVGNLDKEES